jgi:hypothetical protein
MRAHIRERAASPFGHPEIDHAAIAQHTYALAEASCPAEDTTATRDGEGRSGSHRANLRTDELYSGGFHTLGSCYRYRIAWSLRAVLSSVK